MSIWQRIKCRIFGHQWVVKGEHQADIGAERNCACGAHIDAVVWPKHDRTQPIPSDDAMLTWPGKATGMPKPDIIWPNGKQPTVASTESLILAELKAIRTALEAQSQPVHYVIKAGVNLAPHSVHATQRGGIA